MARFRLRDMWGGPPQEVRISAKAYRRERREWRKGRLLHHASTRNLFLGAGLSIGGLLVYWAYGELRNVLVDPLGLLLAAVLPPLVYLGLVGLRLRIQSRSYVFHQYKTFYDSQRPRPAWVLSPEVAKDESKVTIRILLADWYTAGPEITAVKCFIAVDGRRPQSKETKRGTPTHSDAIPFEYPDEFDNPVWPLPQGEYEAVCNIKSADPALGVLSTGGRFRIGPRPNRWWKR